MKARGSVRRRMIVEVGDDFVYAEMSDVLPASIDQSKLEPAAYLECPTYYCTDNVWTETTI